MPDSSIFRRSISLKLSSRVTVNFPAVSGGASASASIGVMMVKEKSKALYYRNYEGFNVILVIM